MSENEIKPVDGAIPAREFNGELWIPADVALALQSKDRAAIDRLTAELRHYQMASTAEANLADERHKEIKRLRAERDAAVADAERYRWLRRADPDDFGLHVTDTGTNSWGAHYSEHLVDEEADAAIDAAMAEGGV